MLKVLVILELEWEKISIWFQEFVARVEEKDSAKGKYESAVNLGSAAGLVQRDSRNANQVKKDSMKISLL